MHSQCSHAHWLQSGIPPTWSVCQVPLCHQRNISPSFPCWHRCYLAQQTMVVEQDVPIPSCAGLSSHEGLHLLTKSFCRNLHTYPQITHFFTTFLKYYHLVPNLLYHPWHMADYGSLAKWTSEPSRDTKVWLISKAPYFCHYPTAVTYTYTYDPSAQEKDTKWRPTQVAMTHVLARQFNWPLMAKP